MPPTDATKKCSKCGEVYPITHFHKSGPRVHKRRETRCKYCVSEMKKIFRRDNPEKIQEWRTRHYRKNSTYIKAKSAAYRVKNRPRVAALQARRRAQQGVAEDACRETIQKIYDFCAELTRRTGTEWAVDHVAPLSWGGPHHEDNLQVVPKIWNQHKAASRSEFWGGSYPKWARDYLIDVGLDIN